MLKINFKKVPKYMRCVLKVTKKILILAQVVSIAMCTCFNVYAENKPSALAYEPLNMVVVKGQLDNSYADKFATLLLVKRDIELTNVNKSDIGYLDMCKIQQDGSYKFEFTFKGNTDDYLIKVNQAGTDITKSVIKAVAESQMFEVGIKLNYNTLSISGTVNIDNIFGIETDMTYKTIIGFYSKDNKLLGAKVSDSKDVGLGITTSSFGCEIPDGADKAKAFVWKNTEKIIPLCTSAAVDIRPYKDYINHRTSLENTYKKLKNNKELKVVFLGGSVTVGTGSTNAELYSWRGRITSWLKQEFPQANITTINAAIGGTGSKMAAYRLQRDVLPQNPDLVFITYAINDLYCGDSDNEIKSQYETIVHNILVNNPNADIISLYDIDRGRAKNSQKYFNQAQMVENVVSYYNIPSINMGRALTDTFDVNNDALWSSYFTDIVHPTDQGYAFMAEVVKTFFKEEIDKFGNVDTTQPLAVKTLPQNIYSMSLMTDAHYVTAENIDITNAVGWSINQYQYSTLYPYYIYSNTANSEFEFSFDGKEIGLFLNPRSTSEFPLEWSVDGGIFKTLENCSDIQVTLERSLADSSHKIKFRMKKNLDSKINAIYYR